MNRRTGFTVALIVLTAASSAARSQSAQSSQPDQTASPAQTSGPQTPQKKVWTNDELSAMDPNAGVSTVGTPAGSTLKHSVPAKGPARIHDAKWYQNQIAMLQAKIPPLNTQIAELQAALDGKPTGDGRESVRPRSVKADDWSRELADLQKRRDDTLARIAALEDQSRHDHVAPNTLP